MNTCKGYKRICFVTVRAFATAALFSAISFRSHLFLSPSVLLSNGALLSISRRLDQVDAEAICVMKFLKCCKLLLSHWHSEVAAQPLAAPSAQQLLCSTQNRSATAEVPQFLFCRRRSIRRQSFVRLGPARKTERPSWRLVPAGSNPLRSGLLRGAPTLQHSFPAPRSTVFPFPNEKARRKRQPLFLSPNGQPRLRVGILHPRATEAGARAGALALRVHLSPAPRGPRQRLGVARLPACAPKAECAAGRVDTQKYSAVHSASRPSFRRQR